MSRNRFVLIFYSPRQTRRIFLYSAGICAAASAWLAALAFALAAIATPVHAAPLADPIIGISGTCDISGNSLFTITNTGDAMTTNYTWEIYQEGIFLTSGSFILTASPDPGSSMQLTINGLYGNIMVAVKNGTTPAAVEIASDSALCENHPTVTINQAAGQSDPANSSPVRFAVVFNSAVTDFDASDVTISGMAGTPGVTVIDSGDHRHFTVEVTGMVHGDIVTATIAADVAVSTTGGAGAGYGNQASTSTDNQVTYSVPIIGVSGSCDILGNSLFTITNTGGPMTVNYTWEIYQNSVYLTSGPFILTASPNPGSSMQLTINGLYGDIMVVVKNGTTPAAVEIASDSAFCENHPTVTIDQAPGQADPANTSPIRFRVVFQSSVTGFDAGDVTISGMAGTPGITVTGGPTTYTVEVTGMAGGETVTAAVLAGGALSTGTGGGYGNQASTSIDNTVTYYTTVPTVTINQASGQADPTSSSPINFTVVFSEAVTDFDDAADVTLSGTAGATTVSITEIAPMDGTTYNVAINGMTGGGTVIADIPAGAALDAVSNGNNASTSTDNTVTFTVNTTTTISSDDPDPSTVGQAVTVNFNVDASVGADPSVGNVTVDDGPGGAAPCVGAVTAGAGSCNITLTSAGAKTLTATYAGSGAFNGSSDTESHAVSTTLAVNTYTDELNADGDCALREAIRAANTNTAVDACPAGSASIVDVITLAANTYPLSRSGTDDTAINGDLDITGNTKIIGNSASSTYISGISTDRVFHILSGTVVFENLQVKNGRNTIGGGINNAGTLTLNNVTVTANVASSGAGGTSYGAGIYNTGTLTLNNSTVSSNIAGSGASGKSRGGGIHNNGGTLTLNSSTVTANQANSSVLGTSQGGGIYTTGGSTTLNSTTPSGNTVTAGPGGVAQGPNTYP